MTNRPDYHSIAALTPKQRLALQLHAYYGTTKEVARILDIAPENASRLLTRGRAVVAAELDRIANAKAARGME